MYIICNIEILHYSIQHSLCAIAHDQPNLRALLASREDQVVQAQALMVLVAETMNWTRISRFHKASEARFTRQVYQLCSIGVDPIPV